MAQIIANEIPVGLINSSNKVYTTVENIQSVLSLMVDGAEYYNFTIGYNTKTITLLDAPTLSVYVDYIGSGSSSISTLNLTTQQDLRDLYYDILREPQDDNGGTSAYPLTLCDLHLNAAQQKIIGGRIINPISKEEARSGEMYFTNGEAFYKNIAGTALSANLATGDTIVYAGTSAFPSSGTLFIAGNIVTYTGKDAVSFTGCSGVAFAHQAGAQIAFCYELPEDYASVINVIYKNKIKLPQKLYDNIFEDLNSYKGTNKNRSMTIGYYDQPYRVAPFYTIKDAHYLIIYNFNDVNAMIKLRYHKLFPNMGSTVHCAIDNDTFARTTIPYLAVAQTLFDRGEEARAAQIFSIAVSYVKEMYDRYNNTDYEKTSGVHYLMGKGHLNI